MVFLGEAVCEPVLVCNNFRGIFRNRSSPFSSHPNRKKKRVRSFATKVSLHVLASYGQNRCKLRCAVGKCVRQTSMCGDCTLNLKQQLPLSLKSELQFGHSCSGSAPLNSQN